MQSNPYYSYAKTNNSDFLFRKALYFLFLVFVFFPYLQIVPMGTDMQPNALLLGMGLFFFLAKKFNFIEVLLGLLLFTSLLVFVIGDFNFTAVRSLANYFALFFIAFVSFRVLRSGLVDIKKFIIFAIIVWFSVSLAQQLISKDFLTFLVSAARSTEDRGVTGLAAEPTFLGIVFVFFILFLLHLEKIKHKNILISLCVVGVVFLAKSSMALLFLIIMAFLYFITQAKPKTVSLGLVVAAIVPFFILQLEGSRIYKLLEILKEDPSSIILVDASINDRFFHVFFSIKGAFDNYLIPNGYSSWLPYVSLELKNYQDVVIVEWFSLGGRIMSGYGGALFELGFFALIPPFVIFYLLFRIYSDNLRLFFFYSLFVNTIMFSAIPIGFQLYAFYIGFLSYLLWLKMRAQKCSRI